jgi:hypothetical protein
VESLWVNRFGVQHTCMRTGVNTLKKALPVALTETGSAGVSPP